MRIQVAVPERFPRDVEGFICFQACELARIQNMYMKIGMVQEVRFIMPYRDCALTEYLVLPLASPAHYATSAPQLCDLSYRVQVAFGEFEADNIALLRAYEQDAECTRRKFLAFAKQYPVYPN